MRFGSIRVSSMLRRLLLIASLSLPPCRGLIPRQLQQGSSPSSFPSSSSSSSRSVTTTTTTTTTTRMAAQDEAPDRVPFDLGRFARTAVYFGAFAPPSPAKVLQTVAESAGIVEGRRTLVAPGNVIVGPAAVTGPLQWGSLDDVVMGGASSSAVVPIASQLEWSGTVTTANNGGFAGVRTRLISPPLDLSGATGLRLKLKGGDGMRFKFLLRDDEDWNGVGWCASFDTSKAGTDVKIPFASLVPTQYARTLPLEGRRSFDAASVTTLQLTLSKFEYDGGLNPAFKTGPFSLRIESIAAY